MNTFIQQADLIAALNYVSPAIPTLGTVHLEASGKRMIVTAQSSELTMQTAIQAKTEEDGECTVSFVHLRDYINTLASEAIEFELEKKTMKLKLTQARYSATVKTADYLKPFVADMGTYDFLLDGSAVAQIGSMVGFAAALKDHNAVLTGVHLKIDEESGTVTAAATDSFRLAVLTVKLTRGAGRPRKPYIALLHAGAIRHISGRLAESERIEVTVTDNAVRFEAGPYLVIVQQIQDGHRFPDYPQIIPTRFEGGFVVMADEISRAIKTVETFSSESDNVCVLRVEPPVGEAKGFVMVGGRGESGDAVRPLVDLVSVAGETQDVRLNHKFFDDGAKAMKGHPMRIKFSGHQQPLVLGISGRDDYQYVIMPMHS